MAKANLILGKKRRDNNEEERMELLIGELRAAINASKCQDLMFDQARSLGLDVPDELYKTAMADADILREKIEVFSVALTDYREQRVEAIRAKLENL